MRHGYARTAISTILAGEGFGPRSVSVVQATRLADHGIFDAALVDRLLTAAAALPADPAGDPAACLGGLALPEDESACAGQLAELLADHPAHVGLGLTGIEAVVDLWPHANRSERMQLRRLWYRSLLRQQAPDGSFATRSELRAWQSRQPTIHDDDTPTANALAQMMECQEAERSYHTLAAHLGPGTPVGKLCCVLGVLAQQILLHHFDRQGLVQNALLGTCALRQLVDRIPMATALVLLSQLGHRIWWCRQRSGLTPLEPGNRNREQSLTEAVRSADSTAAQRAARLVAADPESLWQRVGELLIDQVESGNPHWPRSLAAIDAVASRARGNPPGPDDAAALGAALAAVTWLSPSCRPV